MNCFRSGCTREATHDRLCEEHDAEACRQIEREAQVRMQNVSLRIAQTSHEDEKQERVKKMLEGFDEMTFDPREGLPVVTIARDDVHRPASMVRPLPTHRR